MRKVLFLLVLIMMMTGAVFAQVEQPLEVTNTGELRVVNALLGMGPVDIYLNDRIIGVELAPEASTPYLALPPGQYVIAVYPAGASPLSVPIADTLLDLPPGHSKTAVVYQTRFSEDTSANAALYSAAQAGSFIFMDDNRTPVELGKSRLTALHLAAGTPGKLSIAYPSRASLLHEIALEQPYGDIDIDAGIYPLSIVDAENPSLPRLAFIGERVFQANVHYTLIITPNLQAGPTTNQGTPLPALTAQPRLLVVSAPIEPPENGMQLRVIHAAHSTDVVDIYIDNRLISPRLSYGSYTEYIGVPTYSHLVELRRRDAPPDSAPLATAQFNITPENQNQPHWSLMLLNAGNPNVAALPLVQAQEPVVESEDQRGFSVFNTPGGPVTMVLLPDNIAQTARGTARLRVLHAIDGALEISLLTPNLPLDPNAPPPEPERTSGPPPTPQPPIRLVDPVIFGAEANENEVPAGRYEELEFVAGNSTDLFSIANHQLIPGMVHTFVLIGQPSGEPPIRALEIRDFGRGLPQERLYLGTVTSETGIANVRRLPSDVAGVIGQLESGTEVEVLGRNFDATWIKVRYNLEGVSTPQEGWIFAQIINTTRLGDPINELSLPQVS